jgi:large subunit ribosomal protein L25
LPSEFVLTSSRRTVGHPNRDRAQGFVPGIMYGHRVEPVALRVDGRELTTLLSHGGAHHLIQLALEGDDTPRTVVVKEIQHDPVTRAVMHVDFQAVSARERIHAEVPLRLQGEDAVAKGGGILQVLLHSVRISCLPADLPDHLEVDVSGMRIGHSLTVGELGAPETVTVLNDADEVILSVLAPRTVEAEAPAAPAPAPAPEAKA